MSKFDKEDIFDAWADHLLADSPEYETAPEHDYIPCPACGAGAKDPCLETCEAMYPKDMQGTIDWSNVAATSSTGKWDEL